MQHYVPNNALSSSHPLNTFNYRFQLIEEIEILTTSSLLQRYHHVWQNAHWFDKVQTIYPDNEEEKGRKVQNCLSFERLEGAKSMQESLSLYVLETDEFTSPTNLIAKRPPFGQSRPNSIFTASKTQQSNLSIESRAMLDICSRLLDVARSINNLGSTRLHFQAVFETKLLFGFLSPTEICLLRSPRALRNLLWERNLQFSSVFGHSSDKRRTVNLDNEDLNAVSDPRANFPGCVRWRELIESDGLTQRSKLALDRMRDFLFFHGTNEVIPFLELIISELSRTRISSSGLGERQSIVDPQLTTGNLPSSTSTPRDGISDRCLSLFSNETTQYDRLFESLGVLRLTTNFAFRGGQISSPFVLWNSPIGNNQYSLRLSCLLIPAALAHFLKGMEKLLSPDYFRVTLTLSESSREAWQPICDLTVSDSGSPLFDLQSRCLDILEKVLKHLPLFSLSSGSFLRQEVTKIQKIEADSIENQEKNSRLSLNTAIVPVDAKIVKHDENDFSTTENQDITALTIVSVTSMPKQPSERRKPLKRRAGLAPSLLRHRGRSGTSGFCRSSNSNNIVSIASGHRIEADKQNPKKRIPGVLSYLRPIDRKSVLSIGKSLICMIGEFPFAPLTTSIKLENLITLNSQFFDRINFYVISSTTSVNSITSIIPHIAVSKIKPFFWYVQSMQINSPIIEELTSTEKCLPSNAFGALQSNGQTKESKNHQFIPGPQSALFKPFFHSIMLTDFQNEDAKIDDVNNKQLGVSRSLFMMVTDPVVADIAAPLVSQPGTRVLLMSQTRSLRKWLAQIEEKQKRWEGAASLKLTQLYKQCATSSISQQKGATERNSFVERYKEFCTALLSACPNFKVHVLFILPSWNKRFFEVSSVMSNHDCRNKIYQCDNNNYADSCCHNLNHPRKSNDEIDEINTHQLEYLNDLIHFDPTWIAIKSALNELTDLQLLFPYRSPSEFLKQQLNHSRIMTEENSSSHQEHQYNGNNDKDKNVSSSVNEENSNRESPTGDNIHRSISESFDNETSFETTQLVVPLHQFPRKSNPYLLSSLSPQHHESRLIISVVPMDFLEDCYVEGKLNLEALIKYRLEWNKNQEIFTISKNINNKENTKPTMSQFQDICSANAQWLEAEFVEVESRERETDEFPSYDYDTSNGINRYIQKTEGTTWCHDNHEHAKLSSEKSCSTSSVRCDRKRQRSLSVETSVVNNRVNVQNNSNHSSSSLKIKKHKSSFQSSSVC